MQSASCYRSVERLPVEVGSVGDNQGVLRRIQSITTRDGVTHDVRSDLVRVSSDTIFCGGTTSAGDVRNSSYAFSDIRSVTLQELDGRKTTWTVVGITVGVLAGLVALYFYGLAHTDLFKGAHLGITQRAPAP